MALQHRAQVTLAVCDISQETLGQQTFELRVAEDLAVGLLLQGDGGVLLFLQQQHVAEHTWRTLETKLETGLEAGVPQSFG